MRELGRTIVEARENSLEILAAEVAADDFAKHGAEICREFEVAAFVQLFRSESRPLAVDFSAFYWSAHHKHAVRVAVVGAAIAVFVRGAAEFGHGHHDDV